MKIFIKAHLIHPFFVRHFALFMQSQKRFTPDFVSASLRKKNTTFYSSEKGHRQSIKAQSGLTIFELMVVVSIVAVLIVIAFPDIKQQFMHSEQLRVKHTSHGVLSQSRSFALAYHKHVVVCGSNSSITCNGDWSQGLLAFVDQNRNAQKDPTEQILVFDPLALKYGYLRWKGAGGRAYILFQSINGMPIGSNGSLIYCANTPQYHIQTLLTRTGLIRVRDLNQDGIFENAAGDAIDCD